jgi:S1-C subfamily serine protease
MRGSNVTGMSKIVLSGLLALAMVAAPPVSAQQPARAGGTGTAAGQCCPGCDSAARVGATLRSRDAEIAARTIELAQNRILVEHLRARLAQGSPEAPRSEKERAELQSMLVVRRQEMERLERQLAELCGGGATPVSGYVGVVIAVDTLTMAYPVVRHIEPGSPAARAGITVDDTIISINKLDARVRRTLDALGRSPGEKVTVGLLGDDGRRRDVTITVAPKPATFGGSCLQYRNLVFQGPNGTSFVSVLPAGGSGGSVSGVVRARTRVGAQGGSGQGGQRQSVHVVVPPDSVMETAMFVFPPDGAGASTLFLSHGSSGAIVAGAEVALINGGLKTVFAVDHGALVVNVAPRSPAEQAGILSGDVIVGAQGDAVTAISVLQQAIRTAGDRRNVTLDIVRAKQPKTITLRW